ncbi:MAG: hypothetical protein ACTH7N_16800 [Brevibacterium aurantiacum]
MSLIAIASYFDRIRAIRENTQRFLGGFNDWQRRLLDHAGGLVSLSASE